MTVVGAGSGVTLVQTDRYVVGREYFDSSLTVQNNSGIRQTGFVYRAGDSVLADSDVNYGRVIGTAPAASTANGPGGRLEMLLPRTDGNTYMEAQYTEIWQRVGQQGPFPNTCRCGEYVDNGVGIAWPIDLANGAGATFEWTTAFTEVGTTTTTVSSDVNPAVCGQPITLTAQVGPEPPATGTPTGQVLFVVSDDGPAQPATLNGAGQAQTVVNDLGVGTHQVVAVYEGDNHFTSSSSQLLTLTVNRASANVTVTVNPSPSVCGQQVTVCARVTAVAPGSGTPTGTVTFTGPGGLNQPVPLVDGQACFDTAFHTSGTVTATYAGDDCFTSSSGTAQVAVVPVNTALTVLPAQIRLRLNGTFVIPAMSATLKTSGGAPVAGQTVTFRANALTGPIALGTAVTDAAGVATLAPPRVTVPPTAVTATTYTASFAGTSCYNPSSGTAALTTVFFPPIP